MSGFGNDGKRVGLGENCNEKETTKLKTEAEAGGRKILDRKTAEKILFALVLMLCFTGTMAL